MILQLEINPQHFPNVSTLYVFMSETQETNDNNTSQSILNLETQQSDTSEKSISQNDKDNNENNDNNNDNNNNNNNPNLIHLSSVVPLFLCPICHDLFVDAHTLKDCLHSCLCLVFC